jgi:hypothetical protein
LEQQENEKKNNRFNKGDSFIKRCRLFITNIITTGCL